MPQSSITPFWGTKQTGNKNTEILSLPRSFGGFLYKKHEPISSQEFSSIATIRLDWGLYLLGT